MSSDAAASTTMSSDAAASTITVWAHDLHASLDVACNEWIKEIFGKDSCCWSDVLQDMRDHHPQCPPNDGTLTGKLVAFSLAFGVSIHATLTGAKVVGDSNWQPLLFNKKSGNELAYYTYAGKIVRFDASMSCDIDYTSNDASWTPGSVTFRWNRGSGPSFTEYQQPGLPLSHGIAAAQATPKRAAIPLLSTPATEAETDPKRTNSVYVITAYKSLDKIVVSHGHNLKALICANGTELLNLDLLSLKAPIGKPAKVIREKIESIADGFYQGMHPNFALKLTYVDHTVI